MLCIAEYCSQAKTQLQITQVLLLLLRQMLASLLRVKRRKGYAVFPMQSFRYRGTGAVVAQPILRTLVRLSRSLSHLCSSAAIFYACAPARNNTHGCNRKTACGTIEYWVAQLHNSRNDTCSSHCLPAKLSRAQSNKRSQMRNAMIWVVGVPMNVPDE